MNMEFCKLILVSLFLLIAAEPVITVFNLFVRHFKEYRRDIDVKRKQKQRRDLWVYVAGILLTYCVFLFVVAVIFL